MEKREDTYFIERIKSGDVDAFRYLVERHKEMVFNLAFDLLKKREDAEDIAQEAFVKAFQALDAFRGNSKFSTWLYRIVYNLSISQLRKTQSENLPIKEGILSENDIFETYKSFSESEEAEKSRIINDALNHLNEIDKTIIKLYYIEECSVKEIQRITDLSASNVKVKLHRARIQLYQLLKEKTEIIYE